VKSKDFVKWIRKIKGAPTGLCLGNNEFSSPQVVSDVEFAVKKIDILPAKP
jgi:hypothetical protein